MSRAARPSGFFAFRTPLLPFDEFLAWSDGLQAVNALENPALLDRALAADRACLRRRLSALLERRLIREALFIASPDLDESLEIWMHDPDSERGEKIERALVRYVSRMAGRPTPFGLFAGTSVGTLGERTRLLIEGREKYVRHSRLDTGCLFALSGAIERDPALRNALDFRPNSSLYRAAGRVHYVEARQDGKDRTHHLVAVEDSESLDATLARAADGAAPDSLAAALIGGDVSRAEAESYVAELIDSQILRSDLALLLTGSEPAEVLASQLSARPATVQVGGRLAEIRKGLAAIDAEGLGADPARYRAVVRQLEGLPAAPVETSRLFQVDLVKPAPEASLGGGVLDEIARGVEILCRVGPRQRSGNLERFREAFLSRYEGREVPLVEALDDEVGLGFPPASALDDDGGPLLEGLDFSKAPEEAIPWGAREKLLLRKLVEAAAQGAEQVALGPEDLEQLGIEDPPPLPGAFAVLASVAAASEEALSNGDFRLLWIGTDGPSGARLLGRFCHADPALRRFVENHLRAEEALDPEAVFAEIVHLPEGRLGNILVRPVLRGYEIPYLGRSGAPADRQIPISELLVSVSGARIVLRSARLGRRVVPRLTTAHDFHSRGLPLYRFLCELQEQGATTSLDWDWGPFRSASFLPRVVCGRLVLAPAQWAVGREELGSLAEPRGAARFRAIQSWRAKRRLPRHVILADGDNRLPIDLANVLSVESFVQLVKERDEIRLTEMLPGPDELCAKGPEGRFLHELVVPFVRTDAEPTDTARGRSDEETRPPRVTRLVRSFPPGSEWLYAKLYSGVSTADRLLREIVAPLVEEALDNEAADGWFFIRYADPDPHLRLRLHGPEPKIQRRLLVALNAATAAPLAEGWLRKVQLDTYEREMERYGGPEGIELAEKIFRADSGAVLEILEMLEEADAGADERWRLALCGIDMLLEDFGLDLARKRALVDRARSDLAGDLRVNEDGKRGLGDRFRKESRGLETLLDLSRAEGSSLAPRLAALRRRSDRLAQTVRDLKALEKDGVLSRSLETIVPSFVHMHVNRLLRSGHRAQEFVLYDFLSRLYESRRARRP